MHRLAIIPICAVLLTACETTPGSGPPPVGASIQSIEPGRYRVVFRGRSGASAAEVADRALLAAARTVVENGYDWFEVVERGRDVASPTSPRFSVGVGGGSFGRRGGAGLGTSTSFGGGASAISILEVIAGKGRKPDGFTAYDARAVVESLGANLS